MSRLRLFAANQLAVIKAIGGNARVLLLCEPMWAVPFGLVSAYVPLYMEALGLDPRQIGLVVSVGSISSMFFAALGGHVTDRLGRRRTSLIFDLIGWSAAIILWAAARDFRYFLGAAAVNGVGAIVASSWTCLLVEDTPPGERMPIFTVLQVIGILAGFFAPLAGLAVGRLGLVPAMRLLYLFFLASATTMFFVRNAHARETAVGAARMRATESHSWLDGLKDYAGAGGFLLRNRAALALLLINVLLGFRDTIVLTFSNIYINQVLLIPAAWIAAFPTVTSLAQLVALIFLLGSRRLPERLCLAAGLTASGLGTAVLLAAPANGFAVLIASTVLGALGAAMVVPALNTAWNDALDDHQRAKLSSLLFVLLSLARLPAGFIGGLLYTLRPFLPFALSLVLTVLSLAALIPGRTGGKARRAGVSAGVGG